MKAPIDVGILYGHGPVPNLTALTSTVESAFAGLGSLDLYCVYNDADYRIRPEALQQLIGIRGGAIVFTTANRSLGSGAERTMDFDSVAYQDGVGWVDLVNSPTVLIAPFNGAVHLGAGIRPDAAGGIQWRVHILKNNSYNNNEPWYGVMNDLNHSGVQHVKTPPIIVNSGDRFTCRIQQVGATSWTVGSRSYFWIEAWGHR